MLHYVALFVVLLALPQIALAQAPKNFSELASQLIGIIDAGTLVLITAGFVIYFWGMSVNILKFEDDPDKRKAYFVWGVLVLFVMISIWGIIGILRNTLFGDSFFVANEGIEVQYGEFQTPWTTHDVGGGFNI